MPNILDLLAELSARSRAAINPQATQDLLNLAQTPPFIPAPNIGPMAPALNPTLPIPAPRYQDIPTPGEADSETLAIGPPRTVPGVNMDEVLRRAQTIAGSVLGPEAAPERPQGFLQGLLAALGQGVQAGLSNDPAGTLLELQRRAQARLAQSEVERREDRRARASLTAQIFSGELANERADRREQRVDERESQREQRQAERQLQADKNRLRELLGEQTFRANEAQLDRIAREKLETAREAAQEERDNRVTKRQVELQIGERKKEIRREAAAAGVKISDAQINELSRNDYRGILENLGDTVPALSAGAEKANLAVQAKLGRAGRGGGAGGGGIGNQQVLLSTGQVVPYKGLKLHTVFDADTKKPITFVEGMVGPDGGPVTIKQFAGVPTIGGGAVPAITPEMVKQTIATARGQGQDAASIAARLRTLPVTDADKAMVEAEIKAAGLETAPAEAPRQLRPSGVPVAEPNALGRGVKAFFNSAPIRPSQNIR